MLHAFHALSIDAHRALLPGLLWSLGGGLRTRQRWPVLTELFPLHFPGMIGYGMAKGAVHQLCQSLAGKNSGMPPGAAAIAVLP